MRSCRDCGCEYDSQYDVCPECGSEETEKVLLFGRSPSEGGSYATLNGKPVPIKQFPLFIDTEGKLK